MTSDGETSRRRRRGRRAALKAGLALLAGGVGAGVYARWIEPTWTEVVEQALPVPRLPASWEGVRVGVVADLHHCPSMSLEHLARGIALLAAQTPDLVAAVGDFVMTRDARFGEEVADLLATLSPPLGVFACTGNHDYGAGRPPPTADVLPVADALARRGVRVLLNEAVRVRRGHEDLWVAGVEDLWTRHFQPQDALRDVPGGAASLVLCHNPDAADGLAELGAGAILSGHTHGGQVDLPLIGPPILPVRNRSRYRGLYRVGESWLYINRGLGWMTRIRFCCRPEITVLTLSRAARARDAGG